MAWTYPAVSTVTLFMLFPSSRVEAVLVVISEYSRAFSVVATAVPSRWPNVPYMDSPGGARVVEVMSNRDWTARLYSACS
jgi:hypothetical protein